MKTIGLIGGMSWHSTATYYRLINEQVAARLGGHASARISLQSLDFSEVRDCQVRGDWAGSAGLLADADAPLRGRRRRLRRDVHQPHAQELRRARVGG